MTAAAVALLAAASLAPATATVRPNTPHATVALSASTGALAAQSTLPASETLTLQPGFTLAAAGASSVQCTPAQAAGGSCPAGSQVGSATETFTPHPGLFGALGSVPLALGFYLAPATSAGCDSLELTLQVTRDTNDTVLATTWPLEAAAGTLCPHNGGVQLSFPSLPNYTQYTGSSTITLNATALTLSPGLIQSPSSCPRGHKWRGSLAFGFASTTVTVPLMLACKR